MEFELGGDVRAGTSRLAGRPRLDLSDRQQHQRGDRTGAARRAARACARGAGRDGTLDGRRAGSGVSGREEQDDADRSDATAGWTRSAAAAADESRGLLGLARVGRRLQARPPLVTTRLAAGAGRAAVPGVLAHEPRAPRSARRCRCTTRSRTSSQRWRDLIGYYTRFGDVRRAARPRGRPLRDHERRRRAAAVVSGARRRRRPGWRRDFVLIGDGWEKDGDYNTSFSQTVLPLPSHDRPDYGAGDREPELDDDPVYRRHAGDWADVSHAVRHAARFSEGAEVGAMTGTRSERGAAAAVDGAVRRVARRGRGAEPSRRPATWKAADAIRRTRSRATGSGSRRRPGAAGVVFVHQGPTFDRAPGSHHAAGRVDGRGRRGRRFRSRRLAGLLRDQQRGRKPESPLPKRRQRHVQRRRRRPWGSPT